MKSQFARTGRPCDGDRPRKAAVTVRLHQSDLDALHRISKSQNIGTGQLVRELLLKEGLITDL